MLRFRERAEIATLGVAPSPVWHVPVAGTVVTIGARSRHETFLRNTNPGPSCPHDRYLGEPARTTEATLMAR